MWFFFALASAVIYSFRGILEKLIIGHVDKYVLGFAIRFFALPFFFIPLILFPEKVVPISSLPVEFWIAVFAISCVITPIETVLYYKALKDEEVTLVLPILSLAPVLTLVFGSIILKEVPNLYGIIGIILILFGIYALKLGHAKEGLLQPFHHLKNSRGVQLMSIVIVSYGLSSVLDKVGVSNSNAYFYALINYITVSITLFIIAYFKARNHLNQLWKYKNQFFLIGSVVAGYTLLYLIALEDGLASYAIAIRNASIIFTMILGYLFFKESDIKQKLFAAVFIFLGLVCIKVFG